MTSRSYRTLSQADLAGKRVLLRAGFDVPVEDGQVTDVTRIQSLVPTMRHILDAGAVLVLLSHQGRPKGKPDPEFSQRPLVAVLKHLLSAPVYFASDCIGEEAESVVAAAKPGHVVLLENLRFHDEEKKNDSAFALALSRLGDVYVNDAFTNCHREHASMVALPKLLPSYMGLLLEHEITHLAPVLDHPRRPLALVISGAKMETKVPVVRRFLETGDDILLGGCIANTFLAAHGLGVGTSKHEKEFTDIAREMMRESERDDRAAIHMPVDAVVAKAPEEGIEKTDVPVESIADDRMMLDVGAATAAAYRKIIDAAEMIIWNGPLGLSELSAFSAGTMKLAEGIVQATKRGATTIVGGGDTLDFHARYDLPLDAYTFVSTGGGAMLEFLSGKEFAALEALRE